MAEKYAIVYNTTPDTIEADPEGGTTIPPRTWAAVQRSKVQEYISNEMLFVVNPAYITGMSNPEAIAAKEEYDRLSQMWEAEKSSNEPADQPKEDQARLSDDTPTRKSSRTK